MHCMPSQRVLFHCNGHGGPKPTANGEIWLFNKSYTQYIPLPISNVDSWLKTPPIYVFDCSAAGMVVSAFIEEICFDQQGCCSTSNQLIFQQKKVYLLRMSAIHIDPRCCGFEFSHGERLEARNQEESDRVRAIQDVSSTHFMEARLG